MLILGGDHLGPNPWRYQPAENAMEHAVAMVREYVEAGFTKIRLDASMSCAGDPPVLPNEVVAQRAAWLCEAAERADGRGMRICDWHRGAYTRGNDALSGGRIAGDVRGRGGRDAGRASAGLR